jgi:hypothetical protein
MTCEECEQILLDSSPGINGKGWMPGVSVMNLAKSHAQNCPACAAKRAEIARMKDALDQLRDSTLYTQPPAAVEARLLAAFRREITGRSPSVARVFPWRLVWGSAAAFLLVSAGLLLYSALRPGSPMTFETQRNRGEQVTQRQLAPAVSGVAGPAVVEGHRPGTDPAVAQSSKGVTAKLDGSTHRGIGRRTPLPVGDELSLNGGGSVIRVTLLLSSLVAMGVPVHPDTSDPRVTADVMMDPFGAVVGIRLVEAKTRVN